MMLMEEMPTYSHQQAGKSLTLFCVNGYTLF